MDEYIYRGGKVIGGNQMNGPCKNNLESDLNELALNGFTVVQIDYRVFDGLMYSLVMKRVIP